MCNLSRAPHSNLEKDNALNHCCVSPSTGCLEYTLLRTNTVVRDIAKYSSMQPFVPCVFQTNYRSLILHDSAYLYLSVLNETLARGEAHPDGRTFRQLAMNQSFDGLWLDLLVVESV